MLAPPGPPRLIVVCGLPGAGKSTFARDVADRVGAIRLSADEWLDFLDIGRSEETRERVEALQWKLAQDLLGRGLNVIIEWGTWTRSERDVLRAGARALGADVELHFLDAPIDVLLERLHRRNREAPPITRDELLRWAQLFEAPTPEEIVLFDSPC
jgi:predicted kinase